MCTLTVEDIRDFLPNIFNDISDDRIKYLIKLACNSIEEPCNNDLSTVAWFIASFLNDSGEITGSSITKRLKTGQEEEEYFSAKDLNITPYIRSYRDNFNIALGNCKDKNYSDIGNIFIR